MTKTFKSKIDLAVLLPVLIILIGAGAYMLFNKIIIGAIAIALLAGFVTYLWAATLYIFTNDKKLRIKSGFLYNREIYIRSIKKVKATKNHRASPALSSDRLEIRYNRYGRITISPTHQSEFIRELKEVNPRIQIEGRNK
jgi:hypothetical protein